jgi:hypothetical protein
MGFGAARKEPRNLMEYGLKNLYEKQKSMRKQIYEKRMSAAKSRGHSLWLEAAFKRAHLTTHQDRGSNSLGCLM